MFGNRFFAARYFGDRFYGQGGDQVAPPVQVDDGSAAAWWWQQQIQRYYEEVNRPVSGHAPGAVIEIGAEVFVAGRATGSVKSEARAISVRTSIRAGKADANETCGGRAVVAQVAIRTLRCFGEAEVAGQVLTLRSEIVAGGASTMGACTGAALLAVAEIRAGHAIVIEEENLAA